MRKTFITANELLLDSYRLADRIHESGFRPNFIVGVWRGGAPVGIAIHEFLDYVGIESDHIAIRTTSYTGINKQEINIRVMGLEYLVERLHTDNRLLIVDDVFDSGRSVEAILRELGARTGENIPETIKIACPWYKPSMNKTTISPDFYLHETDEWLVFPHELDGLTLDEIREGKGEVAELIRNTLQR